MIVDFFSDHVKRFGTCDNLMKPMLYGVVVMLHKFFAIILLAGF